MTLTSPHRVNDAQLGDIGRRLSTPLNDDGLRAWYRADVTALMEEVIALRRERAAAMVEFATHPPLEGIDQSADLREVADRLTELWTEQQQGVWQRAEVKRIREKLADTAQKLDAAERAAGEMSAHIGRQDEQIAQLQAQLTDAIADGQRAVSEAKQACADRGRRATELLGQAAGILAG